MILMIYAIIICQCIAQFSLKSAYPATNGEDVERTIKYLAEPWQPGRRGSRISGKYTESSQQGLNGLTNTAVTIMVSVCV